MKKYLLLSLFLAPLFSEAQNTWTQKASIPNGGWGATVSFSIGNYGYVCTGGDSSNFYSSATWRYDASGNSWMQRAGISAPGRLGAVGFTVNGYGYVCSGLNDGDSLLNDVWQYNPASNTWVQKGNFPGPARMFASSFVIGTRAYVTCGVTDNSWLSYANDLWEYNSVTDTWSQRANFPGAARGYAMAFTIGGNGYVGGGTPDNIFTYLNNYWKYDTTNVWTPIASFPGTARGAGVGFSIGNFGYVATGFDDNVEYKDLWKYNPVSNNWYQRTNCGGVGRDGAFSFVINNKAYVGGGEDFNTDLLSDLWMYYADSIAAGIESESPEENTFVISPNPAHNQIKVESRLPNAELRMFDAIGTEVFQAILNSQFSTFNFQLSSAVYFVKVNSGGKTFTKKLVVE